MNRAAITLSSLLLPLAVSISGNAQLRHLSADDMPKVVRITDPHISPDGKTIAVTVARANLKEDRYDAEIELIDIATKQLRVMTHDRLKVGSPRWSPSGDRIAFLAEGDNKKTQIFVLPINGGDAMQLTHAKTSISLLAWSPDGASLAYAAEDEAPEKKDEAKFEDAFEVGNNSYLERSRALPTHLWLVQAVSGESKRLTSGNWSLPNNFAPAGPPSQLAFTPDGKSLLFVSADSPLSGDTDTAHLQMLDLASGKIRRVTSATTEETNPVLSPDGTLVAYAYPREGKPSNEEAAYVVPTAGGTGTDAAFALDRNVSPAAWLADNKTLVLTGPDGTHPAVWLQPIGGKATTVDFGNLNVSAIDVTKDGATAFTATDVAHAPELFYAAQPGQAPIQLTHLQTVTEGVELAKPETVHWKSDKFDVDGILTYPVGYVAGKKYPLVLYIHGGPSSASFESFSMGPQIFAAQGWLVFEPNYRGSDHQGNAFKTAIVKDAGAGPGRDVMAGIAMLEKRGIVDETKIAVSGWSYGGYMTSWLLGNYPTVWKVAVAGAPVTDLVDQYTLSDNNIQRAANYGPSPFVGDNMKAYAEQSPITYAWRIKTPTLIMSDVGDWRVTTTQAYKLYHALKDNHIPVKFVAFPVPGHSPADPIRARDVYRRWTEWLATYLNGTTTTAK